MLPLLAVAIQVIGGGTGGTWANLAATVLPDYIVTTLWLCAGVGIGVTLLGVGSAWLVTRHEFIGRAHFEWALVLPLATQAYTLASDERLAEAASPALAIVVVGLAPVVLLCRQITGKLKSDV
jgi:ABC-type Fe3+ transport system permease subunit